jgi:hypothetical protein
MFEREGRPEPLRVPEEELEGLSNHLPSPQALSPRWIDNLPAEAASLLRTFMEDNQRRGIAGRGQ